MSAAQTKAINRLPSDWLIYEEMSRFVSFFLSFLSQANLSVLPNWWFLAGVHVSLLYADMSADKWTQIMLNSCKTSSKKFFKKFESRQCYFLILQLGSVKKQVYQKPLLLLIRL